MPGAAAPDDAGLDANTGGAPRFDARDDGGEVGVGSAVASREGTDICRAVVSDGDALARLVVRDGRSAGSAAWGIATRAAGVAVLAGVASRAVDDPTEGEIGSGAVFGRTWLDTPSLPVTAGFLALGRGARGTTSAASANLPFP